MPFRFNAKNAFLTYAQCPLDPEYVGNFILAIRPCLYVHVVREKHQDGNHHLHCLVQWIDKFNFRQPDRFDVDGYHPNIQPARDVASVDEYLAKSLPENPTIHDEFIHGSLSTNRKDNKWRKVAEAITEDDCLQAALEASPRDYVINNDKIREYARSKSVTRVPYRTDPSIRFRLPEQLIHYMATEFTNPVGLCPWIYKERHIFIDEQQNRIVLEPCSSSVRPGPVKLRGQDPWEATFTGAECQTLPYFTTKRNI